MATTTQTYVTLLVDHTGSMAPYASSGGRWAQLLHESLMCSNAWPGVCVTPDVQH